MKGFDSRRRDLPDDILDIRKGIWEDRAELRTGPRIGREDPLMPPRPAPRRAPKGRHEWRGLFGAPRGADLFVGGIGPAERGPRGLRREGVAFDEVQISKQILLAQG